MATTENFLALYPKLHAEIGVDLQTYLTGATTWSTARLAGVINPIAINRVAAECAYAVHLWARETRTVIAANAIEQAGDGELEGRRNVKASLDGLSKLETEYLSLAEVEIERAKNLNASGLLFAGVAR